MTSFVLDTVSLSPARLTNVTLEIGCGTTAILGPSGAGKSSLLSILAGYLKPTSGSFSGAASVFWVPQDGGLWAGLTVAEHLGAVTNNTKEIGATLAGLDLDRYENRPPEKLSRGQQARLAVARALLSDAMALVMDEPLAHVDPVRQRGYWDVIREAIKKRDRTLVFATHEPGFALAEANNAICLKDGSVLCHRKTHDLYWRPHSAEEAQFLGPVNWLDTVDVERWMRMSCSHEAPCFRPEQIIIAPAEGNDRNSAKVAAVQFYGTHEAVTLQHAEDGELRTFWHRPARPTLAEGMDVSVETIV